jgi:alpha-glucan,water dikinase
MLHTINCVQVLPGQYAFVLHTASPFSGERGEMYGELVCGLGETLVGNHPGRPLAFSDKPDGSDMQVRSCAGQMFLYVAVLSHVKKRADFY